MTNARKARSAAGAEERATETGTEQTSTSENHSTTAAAGCLHISDYLLHGAENAVPLRCLEEITGLDGRTVRKLITLERLRGVPILSNCSDGYFLPANQAEREQFVKSMRKRAKEVLRVAAAVEKAGGG